MIEVENFDLLTLAEKAINASSHDEKLKNFYPC